MSATNYVKNPLLDYCFGSTLYTPPASYWLGLSTTTIYAAGSGATEPVGYGYARVEMPNDKATFYNAVSGCVLNVGAVTFAISSGSWGTVSYAFLSSASASGSVLYFTQLPTSKVIQDATVVSYSACALAFSIT